MLFGVGGVDLVLIVDWCCLVLISVDVVLIVIVVLFVVLIVAVYPCNRFSP